MSRAAWRPPLALGLMLASGFAGLGYQIVWTQQCGLWLGHEAAAVLAVVAAFFGGLALGALALGARIERSPRPLRWYAACEAAIALWGAALVALMAPASSALRALAGALPSPAWQWTVAFSGCLLLLLPATAAMGATLPALERATAQWRAQWRGPDAGARSIAALYAANTFGAVLGVLAAAFWLVPAWGLARTAALCVALNLLCAAAALALRAGSPATSAEPAAPPSPADVTTARGLLARLALTGLLGIGYEVLVVRVLSQVAEDTVYTFALLLAVYLVGTALGAAAWQRWGRGRDAGHGEDAATAARRSDRLLAGLALACLAGTASLWGAETLREAARAVALQAGVGSLAAALAAEAALALAAFGLPTLVMGALFSQLAHRCAAAGIGFGRALGVNTLGAAAAPLLFGVLLTPWLGPKAVLLLIAAGYLLLARRAAWSGPAAGWPAAAAGAALALALWAPPLAFVELPGDGRVLSYRDGAMAAVSVVEDGDGVARLRINNRQQEGSSATWPVDGRQALLPLLLHPAPRHALFLGLGTGVTAATAALDPALAVEAVELLPEVIEAAPLFRRALGDAAGAADRLQVHAADARRYVQTAAQRYDLVVADNFHPARSGSGALYTVEHFRAVRQRLAADGLFCQWLPLHQLDLETLRSIVRSFVAVYPRGWALLASNSLQTPVLGLVGRADDGGFDPAALRRRLAAARWAPPPAAFGLGDEFALLGSFVAGPQALARFAGDAPANTDDLPVVAYRAPRITYAPDSRPSDRLLALLPQLAVAPSELLAAGAEADFGPRLAGYWRARQLFLDAGRDVRPTGDARAMLAQVEPPLLAALRASPDFRPAYDPLLRLAAALAADDPAAARRLLTTLAALSPARPEAAQALQQLAR